MGLLNYIKANTPRATTQRVSPSTVISEGLLNPNQFNAPAANRFKDSLFGLAGIVPGVGDVASGVEAADLWNRGEKGNAGLAALGMLPFVPALGGMIKKADSGLIGDVLQDYTKTIKADKSLLNEANAHTGQVRVGPKFWKLPPDAKSWVLTHENTHLSGIEDVAMRDPAFWDNINQRNMFGPVDQETGAIMQGVNGQFVPNENMVEAITAYKHDPEWLRKNYPVAFEYIENLFPH